MADRYFPNNMPDFVAETNGEEEEEEAVAQGSEESLMRLLCMRYDSFSERLKRAALDLKETVTTQTLVCFLYICTFKACYVCLWIT